MSTLGGSSAASTPTRRVRGLSSQMNNTDYSIYSPVECGNCVLVSEKNQVKGR